LKSKSKAEPAADGERDDGDEPGAEADAEEDDGEAD
jgi:hypothetical protein